MGLYMAPDSEVWKVEVKNRVKELRYFKGGELRPHPKNPRRHPDSQVNALRGVLEEKGIAGVLMVYLAGDGVWTIIDGECRGTNFQDVQWPCVVLDVNDQEAEYLLATHDTIAGLAYLDPETLSALLAGVTSDAGAVQELLTELASHTFPALDALGQMQAPNDAQRTEEGKADTMVVVGPYRIPIPRETWDVWIEGVRQAVGFDDKSVIAEIRRRLAI